ncbi:MAG: ParB/RepB/Spo0J family partition protein [Anaerorhabdus sp.]
MNILNDMLNNESFKNTSAKIKYISIEDLKSNEKNIYEITDIDELAESIAEGGLMQPILITEEDGQVLIHTGHRRVAALRQLFSLGKEVYFLGRHLDGEVPSIKIALSGDIILDKISLMRSNSYRQFTTEQRLEIVKEASQLYQELVERGEKPPGRQREWICALTGISDGTTKNILAEENKSTSGQVAPEKTKVSPADTFSKKIKAFKKFLISTEDVEIADYTLIEEDIDDIIDRLGQLAPNSGNG